MRKVLQDIREYPDHRGLCHDKWVPYERAGKEKGKVSREKSGEDWLGKLTARDFPGNYDDRVLKRWKGTLDGVRDRCFSAKSHSRLSIGHGNPSPTDVGLTLHHTWGVPVIPGSALKGLAAHYVAATYGPHDGADDNHVREEFAEPLRGDRGNAIGRPGNVYGRLFGSPPLGEGDQDDSAARGEIIFHDALWQPGKNRSDEMLVRDVLTVHHKEYYDRAGASPPNDYDSPNPVGFLSVPRGASFLFTLSHVAPDIDRQLVDRAMRYLQEALREWGVGGKTSSGYGRFTDFRTERIVRVRDSSLLAELNRFLSAERDKKTNQREILTTLRTEWFSRLCSLDAAERAEAAQSIAKSIKSPKLTEERDQFLHDLTNSGAP